MREIVIDSNKVKGNIDRYFTKCIGAGRAAEVMRYTAFNQLKKVKEDINFEYIRFHGLFHDEMAVVSRGGDGNLIFNFQYVDLLFDSLLEIGIRPVVELGLMPEAMAKDKAYVFWWKMNKSMPEKIEEWYQLVFETVRHFTERYGKEEVKKWYFEVWNEPDLAAFFTESQNFDAYFEIYDNAAFAVKSICEEYKIGGPATSGLKRLDEFTAHCKEKNVPVDFVSTHAYCSTSTRLLFKDDSEAFDSDGRVRTSLMPNENYHKRVCEAGRNLKEKGLPLFITEWSASYTSRDFVHDSYVSAPFILEEIKRCEGYADLMSYWVYTDIFEEVCPPLKPYHGGFGLMTVQSVPKPAYHAYKFLNKLSDTELCCEDKSSYVCKNDEEVQLLFWNFTDLELNGESNNDFFGKLLETEKLEDAKITVCGLTEGREYKVTVETIGYKSGDAYSAFLENGLPDNMSKADVKLLLEKSEPLKNEYTLVCGKDGILEFSVPQTENQVDFVTIK